MSFKFWILLGQSIYSSYVKTWKRWNGMAPRAEDFRGGIAFLLKNQVPGLRTRSQALTERGWHLTSILHALNVLAILTHEPYLRNLTHSFITLVSHIYIYNRKMRQTSERFQEKFNSRNRHVWSSLKNRVCSLWSTQCPELFSVYSWN